MAHATRRRPLRPGGVDLSPTQPPGPAPGTARDLVLDSDGRLGEVMDRIQTSHGERIYLRPPGGGREWTTTPERITPAGAAA